MTMSDVLDRFGTEYQSYNGLSAERARLQRKTLGELAEFAGRQTPLDCTANDLRGYLASLVEDELHVNTVRQRLGMARPFFKWAFSADLFPAEELMRMGDVKPPKGATGSSTPRPYSPKELAAFWDALEARFPLDERFDYWFTRYGRGASRWRRLADHVERLQAEAIFALALEAGLRRVEIFSTSIEDIHPDNSIIVVRQRGERATGKDSYREVAYTRRARDAVYAWLEMRARLGIGHSSPWVQASKTEAIERVGEPMTLKSFKALPHRIGEFEYHRFRHTCATLWLRSGMSLEIVQRTLGHSTLQQTLAYAQLIAEDVEVAVEKNEEKFRQLTRRDR
jgi:site-specific recombinase XerD